MIILGELSDYSQIKIDRLIYLNKLVYITDMDLYTYIQNSKGNLRCELVYITPDYSIVNNFNLPIITTMVVIPENYKNNETIQQVLEYTTNTPIMI